MRLLSSEPAEGHERLLKIYIRNGIPEKENPLSIFERGLEKP
jgi:hypothetical protein